MPNGHASIDSLELIKDLRVALIGFAEESRAALGEAEAEIARTVATIQQAEPHWKSVIRRLQEELAVAKDKLRQKALYPAAGGGRQSVVDEKRYVLSLQHRLEEAEAKLKAVAKWKRLVESEVMQYRGLVQPIGRYAESEAPRAVALLDNMADALDAYLRVDVAGGRPSVEADTTESMARPTQEQAADASAEDASARDDAPVDDDEEGSER